MELPSSLRPRKTPRQARSRALFQALVDATARVLTDEGFAATNTNRIAEVAGVSVGSLYQYFPSKESLVMAVAQRHFDDMQALLEQTASQALGLSVEEAVRAYVRAMIEVHAMDPRLHQAISEQILSLGLDLVEPVEARAREVVKAWLALQGESILPRDLDQAAFLLVTTTEGAVHSALLKDQSRLEDPAFEEELVGMLTRYLVGS